jgi:hypothetical protein
MKSTLTFYCLVAAVLVVGCEEPDEPVGRAEIAPSEISLGYPGFARYRITWTAEDELAGRSGDLRASVHLVNSDGDAVRTFDHPLGFEWSPGVTDSQERMIFQSALAPPLAEGDYELRIGLYDGTRGWELTTNQPVVRVSRSGEGFPVFYFSPEWLPVEGGVDRQVLGRRWLRDDGVLRLGELTRPGTLWLQIGVPVAVAGEQELELDEGATEPVVTLTSSCADFSASYVGNGPHQVLIPIKDDPLPTECELAIDTNYTLISLEDRQHRTIALESLSWLSD